MQCFGGCLAPGGYEKQQDTPTTVYKRSASSGSGWPRTEGPEVQILQPSISCNLDESSVSASAHADIKAKIQLHSRSSKRSGSFISQDSNCSNRNSSSSRQDLEHLRQQYLMQHGRNIMSVSTLQQDGLHHFVMPGLGYIAYAMMYNGPEFLRKRTAVVLSDPVCDKEHYSAIAEAFIKEHPKAMFAQVSAEFAAVLQSFGFTVNSMGGETRLDLATYNFTGYARRGLRSAITSATKEGIVVQEVMAPTAESLGCAGAARPADTAAGSDWWNLAAEMRQLDAKWAASKAGRADEVWFINRRPIFAPEPGVRKFIARNAAGKLQGYIFFDGVFEDGELVGYYANVTRMLPDAHPGTLNLMMKTFIERVRAEAQLAAPAKKLSMRRSLRRKQEAAASADAANTTADTTAQSDQKASTSAGPAAAGSAVAAPGPKFLSLGLSPFYQMDNSGFNFCKTTDKLLKMCYEKGEGFYPCKTLAAAKAKYGAGLHDGKYEDAAVEYRQAYLCHSRGKAAAVSVFDLAKFFGLWRHPADALGRFVGHKVKTSIRKARSRPAKSRQGSMASQPDSPASATSNSRTLSSTSSKAGSRKGSATTTTTTSSSKAQQGTKALSAPLGSASSLTAASSTKSLIRTAPNPPAALSIGGGSSDVSSTILTSSSVAASTADNSLNSLHSGGSSSPCSTSSYSSCQ